MTKEEKDVILYLMYDGGADCCKKCSYLNSNMCCVYNPATGEFDNKKNFNDDTCIAGMVEYFHFVRGGN